MAAKGVLCKASALMLVWKHWKSKPPTTMRRVRLRSAAKLNRVPPYKCRSTTNSLAAWWRTTRTRTWYTRGKFSNCRKRRRGRGVQYLSTVIPGEPSKALAREGESGEARVMAINLREYP